MDLPPRFSTMIPACSAVLSSKCDKMSRKPEAGDFVLSFCRDITVRGAGRPRKGDQESQKMTLSHQAHERAM
jgi:hypothetical protein